MQRKRLLLIVLLSSLAGSLVGSLAGCATPLVTYSPQGENVTYNGTVGTISVQTSESQISMAPTFIDQPQSDPPTFTLSITNTSRHEIDLDPAQLQSYIDGHEAHVYSIGERLQELGASASGKETVLASVGGVTAATAAYDASQSTSTKTSRRARKHEVVQASMTAKVYDPGAGMLAGVSVLNDSNGVQQIKNGAGYDVQAAMGIFQHTTIPPGATAVGQVVIKAPAQPYRQVRIVVPAAGQLQEFVFGKRRSSR